MWRLNTGLGLPVLSADEGSHSSDTGIHHSQAVPISIRPAHQPAESLTALIDPPGELFKVGRHDFPVMVEHLATVPDQDRRVPQTSQARSTPLIEANLSEHTILPASRLEVVDLGAVNVDGLLGQLNE
jgi:hypothetical protein